MATNLDDEIDNVLLWCSGVYAWEGRDVRTISTSPLPSLKTGYHFHSFVKIHNLYSWKLTEIFWKISGKQQLGGNLLTIFFKKIKICPYNESLLEIKFFYAIIFNAIILIFKRL